MLMNRRQFLRIAGTSAVIVAASATGGAGFVLTRRPDEALKPWDLAGKAYSDTRVRALSYAILAPNPHNQQPWIVNLDHPGTATLYVDRTRLLPETDPFDRQITIGLGCFLELLRQAAAEDGATVETERFPQGIPGDRLDDRPVAAIHFPTGSATPDPLFAQVLDRRSVKAPFDPEHRPSTSQADALVNAVDTAGIETIVSTESPQVATLRELTWRAWQVEMSTPEAWSESIELLRIGKAEIEANPDGIDIRGAMPELLYRLGVFSKEDSTNPDSTSYQRTLTKYEEIFSNTPAFVWLIGEENDRLNQLSAGRAWLRLNMKATELGLALHPVSQALQEYPQMSGTYADLHDKLSVASPRRVQMLGRLGYGPVVPPSPRWPVEEKIRRT
ncbi:Acg family FMN-binding oxidoreductase [Arhodomonas sp. AD133]|uniref:Acg family FMN-binding oxidoreductase n=1 Tax=Arhodomonas sp. AD133 TaxID=3415009 RepID=UPI003EC0D48D